MQITYYGFSLLNKLTFEKKLVNISGLISGFCDSNCTELKSRITYNGEHLILSRVSGNIFALVMTRDIYRLKSVNPKDQTIKELSDNLSPGERFGVASYIYVKDQLLAVVTPQLAPKFDAFTHLVDTLLAHAGLTAYTMQIHPFIQNATKKEALTMNFFGKTVIEVGRRNGIFKKLFNTASVSASYDELDSIEITIKPRQKKNIKGLVSQLLEETDDEDLRRFSIKAKNELTSSLTELYLNGRGIIRESINPSSEEKIPAKILERIAQNIILADRLEEFKREGEYDRALSDRLDNFNNVDLWSDISSRLQSGLVLS